MPLPQGDTGEVDPEPGNEAGITRAEEMYLRTQRKDTMSYRRLSLAFLFVLSLLQASRPALADPPIPSEVWLTCKPVESMIFFGIRFHVKCDQGWTNPSTGNHYPYLAIAATNNAQVEQAMSTVQAAQVSGKRVRMLIKTGSSSNPSGCLSSDCRAFVSIGLVN